MTIITIDGTRYIGCPVTQQLLAVPAEWDGDTAIPSIWPPYHYASPDGQKVAMYVAGGEACFVPASQIAPGEKLALPEPDADWPIAGPWIEPAAPMTEDGPTVSAPYPALLAALTVAEQDTLTVRLTSTGTANRNLQGLREEALAGLPVTREALIAAMQAAGVISPARAQELA